MSNFRWNKESLLKIISTHIIDYPTSSNLNYLWSFGSTAGICLVIQIITGIFLAMHYIPEIDLAFDSVERIMKDVNGGWFIRYTHANGASMFFIVVYCHIFRGLWFNSYIFPRRWLWFSGVVIFLLMMAVAFLGYVLPWGQMSYWGATVITNLFSAIPFVGNAIVEWLWGGYYIGGSTLNRFFSLHYLLPFVISGLTLLHLTLLHTSGSNNPLGINTIHDNIRFYSYFYVKDIVAFFYLITFFSICAYFYPNVLGHADNYIPADIFKTPPHIVPEWYFLPFYAILRSIPNKLGGVIAMVSAILSLLLLPIISVSDIRLSKFRPLFLLFCLAFFFDLFLLGWIGQNSVEIPYTTLGMYATFYYFFFLICVIPFVGFLEKYSNDNKNSFDEDRWKFTKIEEALQPARKTLVLEFKSILNSCLLRIGVFSMLIRVIKVAKPTVRKIIKLLGGLLKSFVFYCVSNRYTVLRKKTGHIGWQQSYSLCFLHYKKVDHLGDLRRSLLKTSYNILCA